MHHKLIVFDWNGTLLADTRASWLAGNECLKFYGAEPISLQRYREVFTFPIIHFYVKLGLSVDDILARKSEANAVFQNAYEDLAKHARTRRGTRGLLDWIKDQGFGCIILSNYRTDKIKEHLKRLQIDHYFHHVSAHDCDGTTILQNTTKVERLSAFMVKHGYQPQDTVIIGDSMEEPEIARHLGLTSIGITDGYITPKRLKSAAPDFITPSISQTGKIIEKYFKI